jgi:hypothetical protein
MTPRNISPALGLFAAFHRSIGLWKTGLFRRRLGLAVLLLGAMASTAHAHNALFAITPNENQAGGLFYKITAKPASGGGAEFRIVITENQAKFNRHPLAEAGVLKDVKSARSISAGREIPVHREGEALVCVFTASRSELTDPNFCFFFCNLDHALDRELLFVLTKDFTFARLNAFAPEHH